MRPVGYLRSRSLPLLALVEAARVVFGSAKQPSTKWKQLRREPFGNSEQLRQPSGDSGQLTMEGL